MKTSVVMTTFNGEKYLDQQIRSVLDQTSPPDEFIVCDDCSTDGTVSILKRYCDQGKLIYCINNRRLGLIGNFKKVVSMAKETNCIALCDQDDEWLPDKLEKSLGMLKSMNNEVPCMVHTDLILVDSNQKILNCSLRNELRQDKYQHVLQTLLFGNFVTGCTIVMNPLLRDLFLTMPGDLLFHDAWIALIAFVFGEVKEVQDATVKYRKHDSNLSMVAGTEPGNRYRSLIKQTVNAFTGRDEFLSSQIALIQKFYLHYNDRMIADINRDFLCFLKLQDKSYLTKKLAYRRMIKQFQV